MTSSGASEVLPATPHPQPCRAGPASQGGKVALRSAAPFIKTLPAQGLASRTLLSAISEHTFASVLETSWGEASRPVLGAPPPPVTRM